MILDFLFLGGYRRAVDECFHRAESGKQTKIFTPNAEMLGRAKKQPELLHLIKQADLPLPDGIGIYLSERLLGLAPYERTNGIDLAEKILEVASQKNMPVFMLGGRSKVAKKAAKNLKKRFPSLLIAGCHHGYFHKSTDGNDALINEINDSDAEILFVCLGFPMQEKWICDNLKSLPRIKIAAALGGSLDVWSGEKRRAPVFFRKTGLEWLWRTALAPTRVTRLGSVFDFITISVILKLRKATKTKGNLLRNR